MLFFMDYFELSHIAYDVILFFVFAFFSPLLGQNIAWTFSNLRVYTFCKYMMGCPNQQFLLKIEVFFRSEWTKGETA